jgi:small subunit ribosomal protein S3
MGQKTHPYGFRLGYNKPWKSRWYADKDYAELLHEDVKLRKELKEKLKSAGISSIDIERAANKLVVRIYTARPGIIIGRKGAEIDKLKQEVQKRTKRSRCSSKSAWPSAARCAKRWIRRCASVARASRCAWRAG